uniref:Histone-lysine N-methyltransferase n=1 Tax=Setaria digitata TaxID=48799 RepID=A0A915PM90_9BILA
MNSSSLTCSLCTRPIISTSNVRSCSSCRKFTHSDCDSDSLSANTLETEYVCPTCRNSPLVADAMMTSAGNSSIAASPTSISTHDEASRSIPLDNSYCVDSPSNRNSPLMSLSQLDTFGQVPSMSPSGSTALSGPVSSCRASPGSFPEFSNSGDTTDELRFSSRRERSDNSYTFSRTSRGGGVKKPYGRGVTPRTRSLGGVGDFTEVTHSHRGKRGGRGGNKNGRGRRPRGGKTSAMLAMVNAAAANRDADQESSEMDDARHRMEENDYIRTVVVTCADNSYFLQMPLCLICGSIGKDIEGTMVTCVTCSQSYHTYCVGLHDKLNATIVKRGWRCLDCTVCEGCGDGHDESNLILCDECDISYHTYCLEPPLERIPHGPWRCKWCSACRRCGKQISNIADNQRFCEACFTLRKCPKCLRFYEIGDSIIKCQHCARWLHGKCEELYGDEMFETASENGFRCSLCRPQGNAASDAFNVLVCDNVTMNKCALELLHLRCGGALFRYPSTADSVYDFPSYFFAPRSHSFEEPVEEDDVESSGFGMSVGMSGRGRGMRSGGPGRRVMKLGVGGFFVKVPRHRLSNAEEENGVEDDSAKPKIKRFRKPRRSQLEDNYPPVIQESFFGMRPVEGRCLLDVVVDEPNLLEHQKATLITDKQKEACELNEMDSEALRESESLLGNITENDILGNMEEIDFDNLDLNELLLDGDEDDDDDDALENALSGSKDFKTPLYNFTTEVSDKMGPCSEDGQITVSPHGPVRSQMFCSGQQARRFTIASTNNLAQGSVRQSVHVPGYNQASIYAQPRSSSQMGDACTERVNQATEKWEEDEPLGERATKAAVLYANINYPQWKEQYPEWPERVKHIHRMWRSLDANSRQQYVNKARENRANRVKQPRAKRIATVTSTPTGVVRAIVGPNRYGVLSGQESTGGYCRPDGEYNERFKVPPVPYGVNECVINQNTSAGPVDTSIVQPYGAPQQQHYYHSEQEGSFAGTSQPRPSSVRNPQSLVAHLSKEVLDNYSLLQKRTNELAKYQLAIESDLARMRKQKKNLTAKRRQLNKNNQQYDAHGQRIEIELSETDRHSLTTLANAIPIRQKDLENCKRDIKLHSSNVRDFEVKNNIPPELIPQMTPVVQPVGLHVNAARTKQLQSSTPPTPSGMVSPNNGIRPPPSYPAYGVMGNYRSPYQLGTNQMPDYNSGYGATPKSESESAQICSDSPTPSGGRPGSSSSTEWQYRGGRGKRKKRDDDHSEECKRPAMLGDVAPETLTTQFERDIYDVVDRLITQAVIMVDGAEAARKSGMLKKLLESQMRKDYPSQRNSFSGLEFNIPPKPKKKRTQQKKLGVGNSNEYELLLERISTQLRLCPQLPRSAIEPISRIGRSSYTMFGVTDLPDRIDKPSIKGNEIGEVRLSFMGDYYMRLFECPFDESLLYQTMSDFVADVKLPILYRTRCLVPRGMQEREKPVSKMRALSVVRRSGSPPLRQISRIPESIVPEAPPRHAFLKKRESPKKVEVNIIFEGPESNLDAEAGLRQLMVLLGMEQLPDYEFDTPPQTPEPSKRDLSEIQKTESPVTDDFTCRHCAALTDQPAVRQTARQLGIVDHEPKDETLAFCSMNCYYNYMANAKASLSPEDLSRAERFIGAETLAKLRQASADNFAKYLHLGKGQLESPGSSNICSPLSDGRVEPDLKNNVQIIQARELSLMGDQNIQKTLEKKWKGQLWTQYDATILESFRELSVQARQKQLALDLQGVLRSRGIDLADDKRQCAFCGQFGDGELDNCGRLLNADANTWVHVNCALWSEEVYETAAGALINIEDALRRAANVTFICEEHDDYRMDLVLDQLKALRRIYVDREENQLIAKLFHSEADRLVLRVGSLIFIHIGQLLPEQLKAFHNSDHIFPIGYSVRRIFWSLTSPTDRIQYQCTICDKASAPEFVISYEGGQEIRETSASAAWNHILMEVERTRDKDDGLLRLFPTNLSGDGLFGLTEAAVSKMTESLPGVDQLITYTFKHGGVPLMDLPLAVNPSGCARCEPRFRTLIKHRRRNQPATAAVRSSVSTDALSRDTRTRSSSSSLSSAIDVTTGRGSCSTTLDCYGGRWEPGQLSTAYYSQYQKMKKEWKNTVYLARSRIQGLGLYASRDIEMNSMIIEYKGEVIRSEVGEMREKKYEAQNRGVYMFRIDDERLIDATMAGGPARYINHSCDPNCSTRLVDSGPCGDDKKIIIIANRPISAGEELTYDYQFDIEDAADKIPCLCGAPNCQKWMN